MMEIKTIFLFYFIMSFFVLATSNYNQSWIKNRNYEYHIAQEQVNYTTANLRCSELNAGLVMIFDQATQDFLQDHLNNMADKNYSSYWIGLYDDSTNVTTRFSQIEWSYENWKDRESHATNEFCVVMGYPGNVNPPTSYSYTWFSLPCSGETRRNNTKNPLPSYICQKLDVELTSVANENSTNSITETTVNNNKNKGKNVVLISLLAGVGGLFIFILIVVAWIKCRRIKNANQNNTTNDNPLYGVGATNNAYEGMESVRIESKNNTISDVYTEVHKVKKDKSSNADLTTKSNSKANYDIPNNEPVQSSEDSLYSELSPQ